jgi:hypothetical protein
MKHIALFALRYAAAMAAVVLIAVPSCLGPFFETPPAWMDQREETRNRARRSIQKFHDRPGDKPIEEGPELDRQTYRNAKRILAEMGQLQR